jgi:hypothetical protein
MHYVTDQKIQVGDTVIADGMRGVVVCDFDSREFAEGYEAYDVPPTAKMLGGDFLSSGVMINTIEAGLIHYQRETGVIERVDNS